MFKIFTSILFLSIFSISSHVHSQDIITNEHPKYKEKFNKFVQMLKMNNKQISTELASLPLFPYLKKGVQLEIKVADIADDLHQENGQLKGHVIWDISQGTTHYKIHSLISMDENSTEFSDFQFLYLGDNIMSSTLFYDISVDFMNIPKVQSLFRSSNFTYLYVSNPNPSLDKPFTQEWSIVDGDKAEVLYKVIVEVAPDGKGGSFFAIVVPPE